jgi:primosomal protein N'
MARRRGRARRSGCGARRPGVCAACGATKLTRRRPGVTRLAEELARLAGRPVVEDTAATPPGAERNAAVLVGTEAVLRRAEAGDADEGRRTPGDVALLDLDSELLGARFRAAEDALGLLARAARVAGGRERGCRVLVQTSLPGHEAVRAAQQADPGLVTAAEEPRRSLLRLPPHSALASVTGPLAAQWAAPLQPPIEVVPAP